MGRRTCCLCKRYSGYKWKLRFFLVPYNDSESLSRWQNGVNYVFQQGIDEYVCNEHFDESQLASPSLLVPLAIPTIMLSTSGQVSRTCNHERTQAPQTSFTSRPNILASKVLPTKQMTRNQPNTKSPSTSTETISNAEHSTVSQDRSEFPDTPAVGATETPVAVTQGAVNAAKRQKIIHHLSTPIKASAAGLLPDIDWSPIKVPEETSPAKKRQGSQIELMITPLKRRAGINDSVTSVETLDDSHDRGDKGDVTWTPDEDKSANSSKSTEEDDQNETDVESMKYLFADVEQIELLLRTCRKCKKENVITKTRRGAHVTFHSRCPDGHRFDWQNAKYSSKGQPVLNILITAALLCSGIAYASFHRFMLCTKLAAVSAATFQRKVVSHVSPVLQNEWFSMKTSLRETLTSSAEKLIVCGDARFDSPGKFSAKYCIYTLMTTKDTILDFVIHQKGIVPGELESKAFKFIFARLLQEYGNDKISIFCSDRNMSVAKVLRENFKQVQHAYDIWHLAKGLNKKLTALAKKNVAIKNWQKSIVNHLWYCCANCGGDEKELLKMWKSMLKHVQNIHSWKEKGKIEKCAHPPLTQEQNDNTDWIDKVADVKILEKATQNTRLLNQLKHCKHNVHTGKLEGYHNLCLVYSPKRIIYSYSGMVLRTILAILDQNHSIGREVSHQRVEYSKATKQYYLRDVYEQKNEQWRSDLVQKIVDSTSNSDLLIVSDETTKMLFPFDLPESIALVPKPTIEELALKNKYRSK